MFGNFKDTNTLEVQIQGDASGLNKASTAAVASLNSIKAAAKGAGIALGAVSAVVAAFSTKAAADFQQSMADLKAVTSASSEEMDLMENKIKSLGKETKFLTSNIAKSAKVFAKAGFSAQETAEAIEGAADAAAASGEPIQDVSSQLIGVVNGFEKAAEQTTEVADIFAQAAVDTKADINTLSKAMEFLGPVAH
ncbi:MAG: phage tail tape measure protein, partial [Candidatus Bipolaricaulia bacterium]